MKAQPPTEGALMGAWYFLLMLGYVLGMAALAVPVLIYAGLKWLCFEAHCLVSRRAQRRRMMRCLTNEGGCHD
jgi:hypothetical protein